MADCVHAQPVGGVIDQDTEWTQADSPVVVESSLSVTNNAQLRIAPGVTVAFAQGASLEIESGSMYARGLLQSPVRFISLRELDGEQASAGDWGSVVFGPGTQSSGTVLEHVHLRHGHGIQVLGSAPQLNFVFLDENAGAAIDLDLAASPYGFGLSASGNDIDGIRVPAGQLTGDVVWALRGIPYVLEQGVIHVGRSAYTLLPQSMTLSAGVVAELELLVPQPADSGGLHIDLASSVPGVAQVPSSVEVEYDQAVATFVLEALSVGQTTISASHPDLGLATASVEVVDPPMLFLEPQTPSIGIGQSMLFQLNLSEPAGTGGLPVTIVTEPTGIVDATEQLFIAEGGKATQFSVSGLDQGSVMLAVSAEDHISTTTVVEVVPPSIQLPPAAFTSPGISRRVPVRLSHPAPDVGLVINLSVSEAGVIDLPDMVFVDAGAIEAEFDVSGLTSGEVTVTASAADFADGLMQVTVANLSLSLDPDTAPWLPVGISRSYAVRLSDPAPPGGVEVTVSVADPEIVEVSLENLIIPAGQIQATETLALAGEVTGETELELLFEGGQPRVYPVRVTEGLEVRFSLPSMTIGRGLVSYPWTLNATLWSGTEQFQPYEDFDLPIFCTDPAVCQLYGSVTVAQGNLSTPVPLQGLAAGQTQLTVESEILEVGTEIAILVIDPELRIQSLSGIRSVGSARDSGRLRWFVPGGTASNNWHSTLPESAAVQLAILDDDPVGLVDGIWSHQSGGQQISELGFQVGANQSDWFYVGTPMTAGSYRVRAALDGLTESISDEQFVLTPELAFSISSMVTGRGLVSYPWVLQIERRVGGTAFNGAEPLEVSLACADKTVCQVPEIVTIPANQSRAQVLVTGSGLGQSQVSAVAPNHQDATPVEITVVDPELRFESLAGTRSIGSARDSARLRWFVPGGTSSNTWHSTMAETSEVTLAIVDDEPAGLLDGLWNASSGGSQIESLNFLYGANRTAWFYVGTPSQAGVYRVHAEIDGLVDSVSEEQVVLPPELSFNRASMVIGRGLVSASWVLVIRRMVDGSLFNGIEPLQVHLGCANEDVCQVPATVTIPANQSQVQVLVTGTGLGSTILAASATDHEPAEVISIEVVDPELRFESLAAIRSVGSVRDSMRLRWFVPGGTWDNQWHSSMAETSAVMLSILDDDPSGLIDGIWNSTAGGELIAQISFSAGSNRSDWAYVGTPSLEGTYRVAAEIAGLVANQSDVQHVVLPKLAFSRATAIAGEGMQSTSGYLWVQRLANGNSSSTAEDLSISLSCSAMEVCETPATITLPAGSNQAWVPLTGTGAGTTTLSAAAAGHLPATSIPVSTHLPGIRFSNLPTSMSVGSQHSYRVQLRVDESQSPFSYQVIQSFELDLSSNFPSVLSLLNDTTMISSGNASAWVGMEAVGAGQAQITASGSGLEPRTSPAVEVSP